MLFAQITGRHQAIDGPEAGTPETDRTPAEAIFAAYRNAMFWTARDILGDDWAAEDAVMDAFEKICAHPDDFDGLTEHGRRRLVMRITENAALDRWRKRKRRAARETLAPPDAEDEEDGGSEGGWLDGLSDGVSAEDAFFLASDFGSLEEAVKGLPAKYRDAVRLRYGEGCTNAEIAQMYGIAESTVSTRLERARTMLRQWLDAQKQNEKGDNP